MDYSVSPLSSPARFLSNRGVLAFIILFFIAVICASPVQAQQGQTTSDSTQAVAKPSPKKSKIEWQFDLGFSIQHRTNIVDSLDSNDGKVSGDFILSGGAYYDDFFIEASPFGSQPLTIGHRLKETRSTRINLVGLSWFATISEEMQQQGDRLNNINTRKGSFEVGIEYQKQFKKSAISARALHDVLGNHEGFLLSLDHSRPIYNTDWLIIPSWGVTYLSDNMVDYYYGIEAPQATPDRPIYQADSAWTLTGRIYLERPINKEWTMFGFASYSKLSSAITDSPLVSASNGIHTVAMGVLWSF